MQIIRQAAFTATPWKNGGGMTREAIRVPPIGDPFRWRVSVANIEKSGPFSDFAAYNRTMVLLQGAGAALKFAAGNVHQLRSVGDVAHFDGALATHCELVNGRCVDLNLIAAKSMPGVHAEVQRLNGALPLPVARGRTILVFPIDASIAVKVGGGERATLNPWDLAVICESTRYAGSNASPGASGSALVFLAILPDG